MAVSSLHPSPWNSVSVLCERLNETPLSDHNDLNSWLIPFVCFLLKFAVFLPRHDQCSVFVCYHPVSDATQFSVRLYLFTQSPHLASDFILEMKLRLIWFCLIIRAVFLTKSVKIVSSCIRRPSSWQVAFNGVLPGRMTVTSLVNTDVLSPFGKMISVTKIMDF